MKVIRQARAHADAVQWLGTPESLKQIQDLLFPMSPLFYDGMHGLTDVQFRSLGVAASNGDSYLLQHIRPGGWVVRDGEHVTVLSDEQFKRLYVVDAPEARVAKTPALQATHPRALATTNVDD